MKLTEQEAGALWTASFRYYLGRMTIATHSYGEMLEKHWKDIPKYARKIILRDLEEAIVRDEEDRARKSDYKTLGMDMDSNMWRKLQMRFKEENV